MLRAPTIDHGIERLILSAEMSECEAVRVRFGIDGEGGVRRRMKGSFAVAEQQGDVWGLMICDEKVGMAVTVEVTDADVTWLMPSLEWRTKGGAEVPFAIAEEDGYGSRLGIGGNDIWCAIVIDVGHGERIGIGACRDDD